MSTKTKKIQKLGNSAAAIIDKEWLDKHGLKIGDLILMKQDEKIIIDPNVQTEEEIHEEIKEYEKKLEVEE
ncbi:AbrB/MazE/SpoVT family DNA-binding domain-containing protein [Candidatus Borrarchaeum sp.]|uniref:AbrB/MazE/SpoVT family DNA-binding domain-containing protein n=1 Tax=Candidatus Borrarchaeum sp. TaxID=2846742 RepID=UPI00257EB960|nr:AbrB/MazE/SpoVT family DNA-binding domain-containing protein [Candidatus Borrarchaeum sp.]